MLVTAGAGGIGGAIARAFHEAGSRVHVCDVDRSALDRLTSGVPGITGSMADASFPADVDAVFDDVRGTLGGLDVLISNAGIAGPIGPIEDIDGGFWERTIAVNVNSQFYFARRAVPLLKQSSPSPCLIATGAMAGRPGRGFRTLYASEQRSRGGLDAIAGQRARPARDPRERDPAGHEPSAGAPHATPPSTTWPRSRCFCAQRRRAA